MPRFTLKKLSKNPFKTRKQYSHRKTLGAANIVIPPSGTITHLPFFITDQGQTNDCTGFTAKEIRQAKTGNVYDGVAFFNGELTQGGTPDGADLDVQGKTGINVGWTLEGETNPSEKEQQYFFVKPGIFGGPDMFDLIRATFVQYGALSGGLDFRFSWQSVPDGIIPHDLTPIQRGHNVTICNLNCINGVDYIDLSVHWGNSVGDGGLYHLDRFMANEVFREYGVIYWPETPHTTIQRQRFIISLLEQIVMLYQKLVAQKISDSIPPPVVPTPPPAPPPQPTILKYLWDLPLDARHSVRLICDEEGLSVDQKNILTACVQVESGFNPKAIHKNVNADGNVTSTDWGIVQVNDFFHIGTGKDFPSTDYVLNNPEACVRWMCRLFLAGKQNLWSSYKNGAYKQYL